MTTTTTTVTCLGDGARLGADRLKLLKAFGRIGGDAGATCGTILAADEIHAYNKRKASGGHDSASYIGCDFCQNTQQCAPLAFMKGSRYRDIAHALTLVPQIHLSLVYKDYDELTRIVNTALSNNKTVRLVGKYAANAVATLNVQSMTWLTQSDLSTLGSLKFKDTKDLATAQRVEMINQRILTSKLMVIEISSADMSGAISGWVTDIVIRRSGCNLATLIVCQSEEALDGIYGLFAGKNVWADDGNDDPLGFADRDSFDKVQEEYEL